MKALVYEGPGAKVWKDVSDPVIRDDTDAIVRVDATTICGTDLHILKGDVPKSPPDEYLAMRPSEPSPTLAGSEDRRGR